METQDKVTLNDLVLIIGSKEVELQVERIRTQKAMQVIQELQARIGQLAQDAKTEGSADLKKD